MHTHMVCGQCSHLLDTATYPVLHIPGQINVNIDMIMISQEESELVLGIPLVRTRNVMMQNASVHELHQGNFQGIRMNILPS